MSKIAIISQPDQGVLIDVGGCESLQEATQHLTSTLQISSEFWKGMTIDLNLGKLTLTEDEIAQILSISREVGVEPSQIFAELQTTRDAITRHNVRLGEGAPMTLPSEPTDITVSVVPDPESTGPVETAEHPAAAGDRAATETAPESTTAGSAAQAKPVAPQQPAVLYLRQTLRSGQAVSHKGHLVIIGDVNPGAEVMAEGDITVWGALRGIAHAGINGNAQAEIRALRLQPIQIRIAHCIARSPDRPRSKQSSVGPETARIVNGAVRIVANNPE